MFTKGYAEPVPPMVTPYTGGWGTVTEATALNMPASAAWESANRGVWYAVYVPTTCIAKRMFWLNGATVSGANNVEVGIYLNGANKPGAKLITTGSTAQGTASNIQFVNTTDTTLAPGLYWLFMSCSTTSATFFQSSINSVGWDELLRFDQASIGPGSAPSTATPVEASANFYYVFGFSTTTIA